MGHEFGPDLLSADVEIGLQFDALLLGFGYSASLKVNLEVMNYLLDEENLALIGGKDTSALAVESPEWCCRFSGGYQSYRGTAELLEYHRARRKNFRRVFP